MIELLVQDRCTACNACVVVCPANAFDISANGGPPTIARQDDCQTCFMCELYCQSDALYVAPDAERASPVDEAWVRESGLLGQYRRDSGWDEWASDPRHSNEHWRSEAIFARARAASSAPRANHPDAGGEAVAEKRP